jgi:hypothetical protein
MTQATERLGRYRDCKYSSRMANAVDACTAQHLPCEQTDPMVLQVLSAKVLTPKRASLMVSELLRHQQQAKTTVDFRLITLKK